MLGQIHVIFAYLGVKDWYVFKTFSVQCTSIPLGAESSPNPELL